MQTTPQLEEVRHPRGLHDETLAISCIPNARAAHGRTAAVRSGDDLEWRHGLPVFLPKHGLERCQPDPNVNYNECKLL